MQSKETGVVVDFTDPSTVYDNVKQVHLLSILKFIFTFSSSITTNHRLFFHFGDSH
jgi:hypothetical protein